MDKLRVLSGLDVCKILEKRGFVSIRQRGSHCIMQLRTEETTVSVPVPLHDELRRGTLTEHHPAVGTREIAVRNGVNARGTGARKRSGHSR